MRFWRWLVGFLGEWALQLILTALVTALGLSAVFTDMLDMRRGLPSLLGVSAIGVSIIGLVLGLMRREAHEPGPAEAMPMHAPFPQEVVHTIRTEQSLADRFRQERKEWEEVQARAAREATLRRLTELREAGHQMLNFLQRPADRGRTPTARDAVQWYRDEVVSLATAISPGKAAVLDSAFLVGFDGREIRNPTPGVAPPLWHELVMYLHSLLRRLEKFLDEV